MLKDIADVPISDLQKALDDMYLGGLLQYWREKVQVDSGNTITVLVKKVKVLIVSLSSPIAPTLISASLRIMPSTAVSKDSSLYQK